MIRAKQLALAIFRSIGSCQEVRALLLQLAVQQHIATVAHLYFSLSFAVECVGERVDSTDNCFVVDGGARLYFEADACADAVNRSKAELKKAMDSGVFNSLERRIVKVTYVEESDLELSVNDKTAQGEGSSGNDALPSWAWGIIGAGGFIFLLLCAFVCSRRRSKEEDEMSTPLDRGNVDYQPPPSDHENPYFDNDPQRSVESQLLTRTDDSAIPQMEETSGEDTD